MNKPNFDRLLGLRRRIHNEIDGWHPEYLRLHKLVVVVCSLDADIHAYTFENEQMDRIESILDTQASGDDDDDL